VSFRNSKNTARDNEELISARLLITGKVQGVYFRFNMQQTAKKNSVVGWVRNLPDGRVEALLSGNKIDVNNVVEWSKIGPENSRVDEVKIEYGEHSREYSDFVIQHDKTWLI
jgi:acylphosphatase